MIRRRFSLLFLTSLLAVLTPGAGNRAAGSAAEAITIVAPQEAETAEHLAAREIRRYLYLRTGTLVPIVTAAGERPAGTCIVLGHKDRPVVGALVKGAVRLAEAVQSLQPQQYLLKTVPLASSDGKTILLVAGGDPIGTLYGAYRLAEHWGVRFYLHGDVVPDGRTVLSLPRLAERAEPLFPTRGIQPFHDFPEGPDWWNTDDYKAIIAQLPKLGIDDPQSLLLW